MSKKNIVFIILILFLITSSFFIYKREESTLKLPNKDITLITVDNNEERQQGLSGRKELKEDEAMLFVFDYPYKYGIWMKDMNFPIDIIWLDEAFKVIYIKENVSPNTFPEVFFPPENSLYIIEANANFSSKNNILVGNILSIEKK